MIRLSKLNEPSFPVRPTRFHAHQEKEGDSSQEVSETLLQDKRHKTIENATEHKEKKKKNRLHESPIEKEIRASSHYTSGLDILV